MRLSKPKRVLSALTLVVTLAVTGRAAAQCRICDPYFHCIDSHPGAMVCIEGPGSCAMLLPCLPGGGGGRIDDGPGDADLTTWTLFDAAVPTLRTRK